jgi:hypothetical protein
MGRVSWTTQRYDGWRVAAVALMGMRRCRRPSLSQSLLQSDLESRYLRIANCVVLELPALRLIWLCFESIALTCMSTLKA